ncbi:MAG: sulfite exporter TauE/SafE family protein [Candidatus Pacearchaeota archaeon]
MKKKIASFEIIILLLSILSFSYLISKTNLKTVSAQLDIPKGCCKETKEGAICQDLKFLDRDICKSSLFPSPCFYVEECKLGCCYSPSTGTCAVNSPKEKCIENGGEWSDSISCNIPQCQVGCCIVGNQVSLTTSRECTLISNKYNFEKKFIQVNRADSCLKYVNQEEMGACLSQTKDFSGEKTCVFTSRKNCQNKDFRPGYLCTSKELNTICKPTKKTTCVDGKDEVYFVDSCGNIANIYDASRAEDQSYWERPIKKEESCSNPSSSCGNCDYFKGSVCSKYIKGKTKEGNPIYGENFCKNLNCGERKHGEKWCVYDTNPLEVPYPVGSRHFIASCFEGEISIEGCADFMQEICAEYKDEVSKFIQAKCLVNDWRSCIYANDASSYEEVKMKCDENPQCIMIDDFFSPEKFKRSDGSFFAGFNKNLLNEEQGMVRGQAGEVGRGENKRIIWCIPRFTPGFQFWNNEIIFKSEKKGQQVSSKNYGGNNIETNYLCSLANFVCVSRKWRECTLFGGCDPWKDDEKNWECNYNGVHSSIKTIDLPNLMIAMNERCRSIGTCGISTNVFGGNIRDSFGFSVKRIKVDSRGKIKENFDASAYKIPQSYITSIIRKTSNLTNLSTLQSSSLNVLTAEDVDNLILTGSISSNSLDLRKLLGQASQSQAEEGFLTQFSSGFGMILGTGVGLLSLMASGKGAAAGAGATSVTITTSTLSLPPITAPPLQLSPYNIVPSSSLELGVTAVPTSGATATTQSSQIMTNLKAAGITIAFTLLGSFLGGMIGGMLVDKDWSPGKQAKFTEFMAAVGGLVGLTIGVGVASMVSGGTFSAGVFSLVGYGTFWGAGATGLSFGTVMAPIALAIAISYLVFVGFFDEYIEEEYYVMQYNCESWMPPKKGDCELCNNDVRPCSEYRCRSIGSNCRYMVEFGEPGYCASIKDIWQAKISPWYEILSEENKYSEVKDQSFKITSKNSEEVAAWKSLTFGIITDKPARCKIDIDREKSYEEMSVEILNDIDFNLGKLDYKKHLIELNPFLKENSFFSLPIKAGEENNYYIKCMNFAGQVNEAPFVVRIKVKKEPDLTPPEILFFDPPSNSFLKRGSNFTDVIITLNEPAECRFIKDYDVITGKEGFDEMPNNMTCSESPILNYWYCFSRLTDLKEGKNNFYFRCKDKPNLLNEESEEGERIENSISKEYILNVCKEGINIDLLNQKTFIEENNFTLSVRTSGCLQNSFCFFRIKDFSDRFISFFETNNSVHNQVLTLPQGNYSIDVKCEDEARNVEEKTFNFTVFFDSTPPHIQRVFIQDGKINLKTDEDAECFVFANSSSECSKNLPKEKKYFSQKHIIPLIESDFFYIKCRDKKLNEPSSCSAIIKHIKK